MSSPIIYLYVKQHSKTGLKYFGKTIRNPFKYKGSGKRWLNHIRKHGTNQVKTLEIWGFDDEELCSKFAVKFSIENDIVGSAEWANLIIEDARNIYVPKDIVPWHKGKSGLYKHSQQALENLSESHKGLKRSQEAIEKTRMSNIGRNHSSKSIELFREINSGKGNPQYGKKWINNGTINKLVSPTDIPEGWIIGRLISKDSTGRITSLGC